MLADSLHRCWGAARGNQWVYSPFPPQQQAAHNLTGKWLTTYDLLVGARSVSIDHCPQCACQAGDRCVIVSIVQTIHTHQMPQPQQLELSLSGFSSWQTVNPLTEKSQPSKLKEDTLKRARNALPLKTSRPTKKSRADAPSEQDGADDIQFKRERDRLMRMVTTMMQVCAEPLV
jgi:hypothetical protein